jgi:hypothetical protein
MLKSEISSYNLLATEFMPKTVTRGEKCFKKGDLVHVYWRRDKGFVLVSENFKDSNRIDISTLAFYWDTIFMSPEEWDEFEMYDSIVSTVSASGSTAEVDGTDENGFPSFPMALGYV